MQLMLDEPDCNVNATDFRYLQTALHAAAEVNRPDMILALLDAGADIDARDGKGRTPFFLSLETGHKEAALALADAGADVNRMDARGRTALWFMAERSRGYSLPRSWEERGLFRAMVVEMGCDVNLASVDERSPVFVAAMNNDWELVSLLCGAGADPDQARGNGLTPLMAAAEKGSRYSMNSLLEAKCEMNLVNEFGRSALHIAVAVGTQHALVQKLCERGADLDLPDNRGVPPVVLAARNHLTHITVVLRDEFHCLIEPFREMLAEAAAEAAENARARAAVQEAQNARARARDARARARDAEAAPRFRVHARYVD